VSDYIFVGCRRYCVGATNKIKYHRQVVFYFAKVLIVIRLQFVLRQIGVSHIYSRSDYIFLPFIPFRIFEMLHLEVQRHKIKIAQLLAR